VEETSRGTKTLKYHPWKKIINDEAMIKKIHSLGSKLNLLPYIGDGDAQYRDYIDSRRNVSSFDYGLIHSDEEVFDDEALVERGKIFLKTFATGNLTKPLASSDPVTGRTDASQSSEPAGRFVGEYTHYAVEDKEVHTTYEVDITKVGGHISRFNLSQRNSEISSLEEVVNLGKGILEHWKSYEGVNLKLIQTQMASDSKDAHFVYAAVVEDVIVNSKMVILSASMGNNERLGVTIDAFEYFNLYNYPINHKPQLTKEEAVASLSPQMIPTKEPWLEIKRGTSTLVYAIPVTGVKWVNVVYINAVTGEYEGIEYDYTRP